MNTKIFIEFENQNLANISEKIYDLFIENNYNTTLLDNTFSLNEKIDIIKKSNNKNLILSNKINTNDANAIEIVYPLRSNNELEIILYNSLNNTIPVTKYYQLRATTNTMLDYYEILRNINNNDALIIKYGINTLNQSNLPTLIYQSITNYLMNENIYTVKSGDSLYSIARNFNTSVDEIKRLNSLSTNNLSIGQKLIIPTINTSNDSQESNNTYTVKSGDSLYSIARNFNTSVDEIKRLNSLSTNNLSIGQKLIIPTINTSNDSQESNNIYTVKSGDSLYAIARSFNTTVDNLKKLNNLTTNNLSIGQKLIIS